jgi:hypothetical protein
MKKARGAWRGQMRIPVFGSCPTSLNNDQEATLTVILSELGDQGLEMRTLGRTDYPVDFPLREVFTLARQCCGGIILGFTQFDCAMGTFKRGTPEEHRQKAARFSTPWNQIEAGILYALRLPLLVFREPGIAGGVFDAGATDAFVHQMPGFSLLRAEKDELRDLIRRWSGRVRGRYYDER